jgi:hypothetical protein
MNYDVKISNALLDRTVEFLESLDTDDFQPETIQLFGYVLYAFRHLKSEIVLREAFNAMLSSEDGKQRFKDYMNSAFMCASEPF